MKKSFFSSWIKNNLSNFLILLILIFTVVLINKINPVFYNKIKTEIFSKNINFAKINNFTKKIFGREFLYTQSGAEIVFDETLLDNPTDYYNSQKFTVSRNLPVGTLQSGVVVFVGSKDIYNKTVIVQGVDGFNIWYSNIDNINVELYDYVEKNTLIGECLTGEIYLTIEKDGKIIKYEHYK